MVSFKMVQSLRFQAMSSNEKIKEPNPQTQKIGRMKG